MKKLRIGLAFVVGIAASSALHAVITPAAQDSPVVATSGMLRMQPPIQQMEWAELSNGSEWYGQELETDYVSAFHLDPGLKHRLLYRELRKQVRGTLTAETTIESGAE